MADYSQYKGQEGQEPWYDLWTGHVTATEAVANEVEAARIGETSLAFALNSKASITYVQEYVQAQILTGGIDLEQIGTPGQILIIGNDYSLKGTSSVDTELTSLNKKIFTYSLLFGS